MDFVTNSTFDLYIDGVKLDSDTSTYRVTSSVDNVATSLSVEFTLMPSNVDTIDYNSAVVLYENGVLLFNGLIDTDNLSQSPDVSWQYDCVDWLARVQANNVDAEGFLFGGISDANGNLTSTGGIAIETVVRFLLYAAGVPNASVIIPANSTDTNIAIDNPYYTGNVALFGGSAAFLMGTVVPFYGIQTGIWDMISEIMVWNGFTVYAGPDGLIRWNYISPTASNNTFASIWNYTYGDSGASGYQTTQRTRTGQYSYNRIEVTGVDATGAYDDHGHKCSQVAAIAQALSPVGYNGKKIIPNNPLNEEVMTFFGASALHAGFRPLQIQSNAIDVPIIAEAVAKMVLKDANSIYEEITIESLPRTGMKYGDTIHISGDPHSRNNGDWVIKEVDNSRDTTEHKYTITAIKNNWGDSKYGAGI